MQTEAEPVVSWELLMNQDLLSGSLLETLELHDVCGSPELSSLLMFWLSTNFGSRSETMMVSLQE